VHVFFLVPDSEGNSFNPGPGPKKGSTTTPTRRVPAPKEWSLTPRFPPERRPAGNRWGGSPRGTAIRKTTRRCLAACIFCAAVVAWDVTLAPQKPQPPSVQRMISRCGCARASFHTKPLGMGDRFLLPTKQRWRGGIMVQPGDRGKPEAVRWGGRHGCGRSKRLERPVPDGWRRSHMGGGGPDFFRRVNTKPLGIRPKLFNGGAPRPPRSPLFSFDVRWWAHPISIRTAIPVREEPGSPFAGGATRTCLLSVRRWRIF